MAETLKIEKPLPVGNLGPRNTGLWGAWTLILTEGSLFAYLLVTYAYLALTSGQGWPPEGPPKLIVPAVNTLILLASSGCVVAAERWLRRGRRGLSLTALVLAVSLGAVFIAVQMHEWAAKGYGPAAHLYGSLYFTITGFHMAHVAVGALMLASVAAWTGMGRVTAKGPAPLVIAGLYWHFVDAVWLVIFSVLYLLPHLHG
jgi:cytochrome c oxidase subunit 3